MNNLGNINTTQQRPISQVTPAASNNGVAQQQFLGATAPQLSQPQFNANILQLLLMLIQQLLQLISDQKPDQPEQPQNQTLNPDDATRDKLADILGVPANTLKVTDRDGNGQLSVGDLVEGTVKNDVGQDEAVSSELSVLALKDINGKLGSALTLDPPDTPPGTFSKERLALNNVVGVQSGATDLPQGSVIETVFDSDNGGRISAGDVVAIRTTGAEPLSLNYVELSADDVKQFENQAYGQDLALSQDDLRRLTGLEYPGAFGGTPPFIQRAFDTDGDGQVSVGDTIETAITRPGTVLDVDIAYSEITQDVADRFNAGNESLPVSVSTRGAHIGQSITGEVIPNDRVVTLNGRNYSVGFLKQQADSYANSSFTLPPSGGSEAAVNVRTPWGVGSSGSQAREFEAYIRDTFPNGDPGVPANPAVRYEGGDSLIVNGQAYIASQIPSGIVAPDNLLISTNSDSDNDVARELVNSFGDVQITTEFSNLNGFLVQVPADYLTQWKSALQDNLPAEASVNFNRGISTSPGTPGA